MRLLQKLGARGHYAPRFNDAAVDRARSQCATEFLHSDCDVMIQIDSDIVFEADDAIRICEAAVERDVIGGVYVTRGKGGLCQPTSLIGNDRRIEFGNDPSPVKALCLAGGFHAVHRRVFERLAKDEERMPLLNAYDPFGQFHPFYIPTWTMGPRGLFYLSEDWALSHRAREAGFGVWLDPSVRLLHLGQHAYVLEDMLANPLPPQWMALTRHQDGSFTKEILKSASAGEPPAA
jgi:hypothetical protein